MFGNFLKKPEIQELRHHQVLQDLDITQLRRNVEILFVDDEELPIIDILRKLRFNVEHKVDINNLNDVYAYDIILCDIRGVGKQFGSPQEGAYLIKEIKASFPNKVVIAYTGSTYDATYNDFLKFADNVLAKDISIDVWTDVLDSEIKKSIDPTIQWRKMRARLLEHEVSIQTVRELEAMYVKSIKTKSFESFKKFANQYGTGESEAVKKIVTNVLQSLLVRLIVKGIAS